MMDDGLAGRLRGEGVGFYSENSKKEEKTACTLGVGAGGTTCFVCQSRCAGYKSDKKAGALPDLM